MSEEGATKARDPTQGPPQEPASSSQAPHADTQEATKIASHHSSFVQGPEEDAHDGSSLLSEDARMEGEMQTLLECVWSGRVTCMSAKGGGEPLEGLVTGVMHGARGHRCSTRADVATGRVGGRFRVLPQGRPIHVRGARGACNST
ncbi:hypothetical protein BD311DRAFT_762974 [Dichomitus squalens]|uniref:Uncharacterized protein n=1 Tax=Dichomitus squalens TaxID=114155 RepID=A0A4Q9MI43_9APHY|nr:hypothetical protein BD311DRAFT_762974 [Dichomitus squalens]